MAWVRTLEDMPSSSWPVFLASCSPAVVALLFATARWVESRARITSEVARSISRELEMRSGAERERHDDFASEIDAPDPKKSSTKEITSTSHGDDEAP